MSTENILTFIEAVKTNPELKAKVLDIPESDLAEVARQAASLAAEYGYAVSAEELLGVYQSVSDEELEGVAGGGALCRDSTSYPHTGKSFSWDDFVEGIKKIF